MNQFFHSLTCLYRASRLDTRRSDYRMAHYCCIALAATWTLMVAMVDQYIAFTRLYMAFATLLALMLLTDARRAARVSACGATVPPAEQDRRLWNRELETEGRQRLETALRRKRAGPFQIKAAISACQMAEPAPDWPQILHLYTALLPLEPTPVVRINHAVAMAENGLLAAALATLNELHDALADFQPFHSARAAVLSMAGQIDAARRAYDQAIALTTHESDRRFLVARAGRL